MNYTRVVDYSNALFCHSQWINNTDYNQWRVARSCGGVTVAALLDELDLSGQRLAVELNQEIVPRSTFAKQILQAGDQVEIVRAIGGG